MSSFNSGNDFTRQPAKPEADLPTTCPACRSKAISTTSKSPDASSYWRCGTCGEVWNVSRRVAVGTGAYRWR